MILKIDDWKFDINLEDTRERSSFSATEHCTCGYCDNYYRSIRQACPHMEQLLSHFGLDIEGPVEMLPFEPTICLVGYRVTGRILEYGLAPIMVDQVPILPKGEDDAHFRLEVGELQVPWVLSEDPDEVISPANEPEYLEMMYRRLLERRSGEFFMCS